jgi:predicted NUDIX family phosphoesterase
MAKSSERVLVVPTARLQEIGVFHGFTQRVKEYLPRLLDPENLSYRPRAEVETDPSFKQIIPYVVLRWLPAPQEGSEAAQIFHYTRGKRATESRLQALRSIGVGGHIRADDTTLFDSPYREAIFREVQEEVRLETAYTERCVGLINDDSTPVGQVHLGIVHVFDLQEPRVQPREQALIRAGFASLAELRAQRQDFETWSQFLLDHDFMPRTR